MHGAKGTSLKIKFAFLFLLLSPVFCLAFQWPVENPVLTATFCENRWNHFHGGIDIGGGEQEIKPIEDGEVIFIFDSENSTSDVPTGLGNFVVVEHARGIRSLYAHLKEDSLNPDKIKVTKNDVLGVIGNTGSSLGKHLHLEVSDKELRQIVNPMRLLPELYDSIAPTINDIKLIKGTFEGEAAHTIPVTGRYDPLSGVTISPGVWTVLLNVFDLSEHVDYFCPMAPYRVQLFLNGQLSQSLVFDGLGENKNRLELIQAKGISFETFFLDDWLFNAGSVTVPEGDVRIEIVVSDYAGNETSRLLPLTARRE